MYRAWNLPTVKLASCGGKSVVTSRCRKIWFSWFSVVCFSALVIGSGGIILSWKENSVYFIFKVCSLWAAECFLRSTTHPDTRGKAWVRPRGKHINGERDGKARQTSMYQGVPGQWCESVSRINKEVSLLVQKWGNRLQTEPKVSTYINKEVIISGIYYTKLVVRKTDNIPHISPPFQHYLPISQDQGDERRAAASDWQTERFQFFCQKHVRKV